MLFLNKSMNVAVVGFSDEARSVIQAVENKLIDDVYIRYIFTDYKDLTNPIFNFIKHKVISSYDKIIDDTSVDVVMVLDDNDECYNYIKQALYSNKHVITSSTGVISKHHVELFKIANDNSVGLYIDPTINFPLPITNVINHKLLKKIYHFHTITDIKTHDVIGVMQEKGISLEEAKAYWKIDELNKDNIINEFAIITMLAYDMKVESKKIYYRGLDGLDLEFLKVLDRLGYRLRLQGSAYFHEDEVELIIEPVVHKNDGQMYYLDYNATQSIVIFSSGIGYNINICKSGSNSKINSIIENINSIKNDIKTKIMPKNSFECLGNDNSFAKYIIKADSLDKNIVDKMIGNVFITKHISGTKIKELGEKITFYARISSELTN